MTMTKLEALPVNGKLVLSVPRERVERSRVDDGSDGMPF